MSVKSQIGSGALPVERIPSWAIAVSSRDTPSSGAIMALAAEFRQQPRPIIGRIYQDHLLFDLRTLHDPQPLVDTFASVLSL
jgi:L-seryl-tRNA(Ser) seleniumtransferase